MKKVSLNIGWERSVGESASASWLTSGNPKVTVNLPDDYIINMPRTPDSVGGAAVGFFPGGRAVYTKSFDV